MKNKTNGTGRAEVKGADSKAEMVVVDAMGEKNIGHIVVNNTTW